MVKFVDEVEDDVVISHNFKLWTRELTIHRDALVSSAQPLHWFWLDLKSSTTDTTQKHQVSLYKVRSLMQRT